MGAGHGVVLYYVCILPYFVCVFSQDLHGTCVEGVVPGHISGNYGSPSKYSSKLLLTLTYTF